MNRASSSGAEVEGLPRASVSLSVFPRKAHVTAERQEETWPGALYCTGGETEAQGRQTYSRSQTQPEARPQVPDSILENHTGHL